MNDQAQPHGLSCPSCGAPLSERIVDVGREQCAFCDVISLCTPDKRHATADHELTSIERSVGKVRRYGTVVLAPLLGISVCVILNFGRHFRNSENAIELSVFIGACILALLALRRRIVAAVWTLFFCLALLNERAIAFFPVAPDSRFSFTSEVSLIPFIAAGATFAVFALVFWSSEQLAHEQQKLSWRWSVALTFTLGLGAGGYWFSPPYTGEVHRAWSWAHAQEAVRLLRLEPQLEPFTHTGTTATSFEPRVRWVKRDPGQSNVVFLPYATLAQLPDLQLYTLEMEQRGDLVGHYAWNFENATASSRARAHFIPMTTAPGWRQDVEAPLTASWVVIYDIGPTRTRYWLARRIVEQHFDVGPAPSTLELAAYRSSDAADALARPAEMTGSEWILASLARLTGAQLSAGTR